MRQIEEGKMMRSMTLMALSGIMALVAVTVFNVAPTTADETVSIVSTVDDPIDDAYFPYTVGDSKFPFAAPFLDMVRGQLTKTENGDFELLMEMADSVPDAPIMPKNGVKEIWWFWVFEFDPATPAGYPWHGAGGRPPEFIVAVSWDGTAFTGTAIDRRPLLTGGDAILTPVPFSINGTIVKADLAAALIGDVPASFGWGPFTFLWSGPVGSEGVHFADYAEARAFFP